MLRPSTWLEATIQRAGMLPDSFGHSSRRKYDAAEGIHFSRSCSLKTIFCEYEVASLRRRSKPGKCPRNVLNSVRTLLGTVCIAANLFGTIEVPQVGIHEVDEDSSQRAECAFEVGGKKNKFHPRLFAIRLVDRCYVNGRGRGSGGGGSEGCNMEAWRATIQQRLRDRAEDSRRVFEALACVGSQSMFNRIRCVPTVDSTGTAPHFSTTIPPRELTIDLVATDGALETVTSGGNPGRGHRKFELLALGCTGVYHLRHGARGGHLREQRSGEVADGPPKNKWFCSLRRRGTS
ncbi:hypothetical protein DFH06DRAFT_1141407 [Mycena polygramma]|nr:hypothetical protein DFH06DRAFT_1141407 [Mycena polygramma]